MDTFSDKHVLAAIARLSRMPSKDVKVLRDRAAARGLNSLVEACKAEIALRPFEFTGGEAVAFQAMAEKVKDLDLQSAIHVAFTEVLPANEQEVRVLRWIAANPGGSYQEAEKAYGKRDLGLLIGHLVYDRFGCFRKFMKPKEDQSSVLILKDRAGPSVRYRLRPEAQAAFGDIGLFRQA